MEIHGGNITLDETQAQIGAGVDSQGFFRVTKYDHGESVARELLRRLKLVTLKSAATYQVNVSVGQTQQSLEVNSLFPERVLVHNQGIHRAQIILTAENDGSTLGPFTLWPKGILDRSVQGGWRHVNVAQAESAIVLVSVEAHHA